MSQYKWPSDLGILCKRQPRMNSSRNAVKRQPCFASLTAFPRHGQGVEGLIKKLNGLKSLRTKPRTAAVQSLVERLYDSLAPTSSFS